MNFEQFQTHLNENESIDRKAEMESARKIFEEEGYLLTHKYSYTENGSIGYTVKKKSLEISANSLTDWSYVLWKDSTEWTINIGQKSIWMPIKSLRSFLKMLERDCNLIKAFKDFIEIFGETQGISMSESSDSMYKMKIGFKNPVGELSAFTFRSDWYENLEQLGKSFNMAMSFEETQFSRNVKLLVCDDTSGFRWRILEKALHSDEIFYILFKMMNLPNSRVEKILEKNKDKDFGVSTAEIKHQLRGHLTGKKFGF